MTNTKIWSRLLFAISIILLSTGNAYAARASWVFSDPTNFEVSNPESVTFVSNEVRLRSINQSDRDNSVSGFGGGNFVGTSWNNTTAQLEINNTNAWELPNDSSLLGWTPMNKNVLLLHLNEVASAVEFADASANQLILTCVGSKCPASGVVGKLNVATYFDGSDDYIQIFPFNKMPRNQLTVSFWAKSSDNVKDGTVFSYAIPTNSNEFLLYNHKDLDVYVGGAATGSTGVSFNDGKWHHIAVSWTKNSGSLKIYKDGLLVYQTNVAVGDTLDNNGSLILGQEQDSVGGSFNINEAFEGQLDELALYNRVLSANEIKLQFEKQRAVRSGYFVSRIFNANSAVVWSGLGWESQFPSQQPLPINSNSETGYNTGNADMTDNFLLYHMDEFVSSIVDYSGNNNSGAYNGILFARTGRIGESLGFDGVNDHVVIPDSVLLNPTSAVTMESWVYPEANHEGNASIISKGSDANFSYRLKFRSKSSDTAECSNVFTDADMRAEVVVSGVKYVVCWGDLSEQLNEWHHFAGVYDGNNLLLFWDGSLRASVPVNGALDQVNDPLELGGAQYGDGEFFKGRLDELAIFGRALNADEILAHYLRGATKIQFQVRACAVSDCSDGVWQGNDGTINSFYSAEDLTGLSLPEVNFGGFGAKQFFQYSVYLQSDDLNNSPALHAVNIKPDHFQQNPVYVQNVVGIPYANLISFVSTPGPTNVGNIRFQISPDGDNWYYYKGGEWEAANGYAESNTSLQINTGISKFASKVGAGNFFFRAYLDSLGGSAKASLANLFITYSDETSANGTASTSDSGDIAAAASAAGSYAFAGGTGCSLIPRP